MEQRAYNTALYCRLSCDDELFGGGSGISTQELRQHRINGKVSVWQRSANIFRGVLP